MIHCSNQLVTFCELLRLWLIIAVLIIIFIFAYTKATFGLGWKTHCLRLAFFFSHFFFFWHAFVRLAATVHALCMNSSRKIWLFLPFSAGVHFSWTHKFHFSATFSLKMGPTVLFRHLKIFLLQYFSIFNFSFQLYPNGS